LDSVYVERVETVLTQRQDDTLWTMPTSYCFAVMCESAIAFAYQSHRTSALFLWLPLRYAACPPFI
jgi:hypothetical protein